MNKKNSNSSIAEGAGKLIAIKDFDRFEGITNGPILGAGGFFEALSKEEMYSLLSFFNDQSPTNWIKIKDIFIAGPITVDLLWAKNEESAKKALKFGRCPRDPESWITTPSPEALIEWINKEIVEQSGRAEKVIAYQSDSL